MKKQAICLSVLSTLIFGAAPMSPAAWAKSEELQIKTTIIDTKGVEVGTAVLTQKADVVHIHVEAKSLPPGEHGIHFHENGKCDPPDFMTSGAHLNPESKEHGFKNPKGFHAGDLLNLVVKADGTVNQDLESKTVTLKKDLPNSLLKSGGTSLMIHEKADDYVTDPTGNSGARIACSVIR
ncbi:superoxide dismutase family protein [Paenibacillus sp.]|jgi:Cu-Zn family superoxide dismutase|uniref:superoxide dismutase family protein n=1 Tax=Paenibacillus sp. TaxID=58172 RepID=UPI002834F386|nr:superoxide dismutase family protein [Paenibacillus sp.]MDR0271465.1 superoxide dismutase family protein [Paenibacillus sp.]